MQVFVLQLFFHLLHFALKIGDGRFLIDNGVFLQSHQLFGTCQDHVGIQFVAQISGDILELQNDRQAFEEVKKLRLVLLEGLAIRFIARVIAVQRLHSMLHLVVITIHFTSFVLQIFVQIDLFLQLLGELLFLALKIRDDLRTNRGARQVEVSSVAVVRAIV